MGVWISDEGCFIDNEGVEFLTFVVVQVSGDECVAGDDDVCAVGDGEVVFTLGAVEDEGV